MDDPYLAQYVLDENQEKLTDAQSSSKISIAEESKMYVMGYKPKSTVSDIERGDSVVPIQDGEPPGQGNQGLGKTSGADFAAPYTSSPGAGIDINTNPYERPSKFHGNIRTLRAGKQRE